jgi:hypothetical protein
MTNKIKIHVHCSKCNRITKSKVCINCYNALVCKHNHLIEEYKKLSDRLDEIEILRTEYTKVLKIIIPLIIKKALEDARKLYEILKTMPIIPFKRRNGKCPKD